MTSPRTPFFWDVNVNVPKVARARSARGMDTAEARRDPIQSWTSARRKGQVSEAVPVYSPGRRRKKKAMIIMSAMAWLPGSSIA
jgi:hypothetical protein